MNKIEEALKMFKSIRNYHNNVVQPFFSANVDEFYLSDEEINYVKMILISNILAASKETLVDDYKSRIYIKELEKSVLKVACKRKKKYIVDGVSFKDVATVTTVIRNKISHGNYVLNAKIGEVTLLKGDGLSKDININLHALSNMVVSLFGKSLKFPRGSTYRRSFAYSDKVESRRIRPFLKKNDLLEFLETVYLMNITLANKNGKEIEEHVFLEFDKLRLDYPSSQNMDLFNSFNKKYEGKYEISVEIFGIDENKLGEIAEFLMSVLKGNTNYQDQTKIIIAEIQTLLDRENGAKNLVATNVLSLFILDLIFIKNIRSVNVLLRELNDSLSEVIIFGYNWPFSTALALFTSLFSYNLDDLYKNRLSDGFKGLDYSFIDLSKIEILKGKDYCNNEVMNLLNEKKAKERNINNMRMEIKNKEQQYQNLEKKKELSDKKILEMLRNTILNIKERIVLEEERLKVISERLVEYSQYCFENMESFQNEIIIESIRNSIMHGCYYLNKGSNLETTKIIFNDIYKGELTFSARVGLIDFIDIIVNGANIIEEEFFCNEKKYIKN